MGKRAAQLHVLDHPLITHMLTAARDERTQPQQFRQLLDQCGALLAYEATRNLKLKSTKITTPMEPMVAKRLHLPITIVPILRAGLGLADGIHRLLPDAQVGHIGIFRDEKSLTPVSYYAKLPADSRDGTVLLIDPMLATGGSAVAAAQLLADRGCEDVRLLTLVAAPEGVERVHKRFPQMPIYTAALDRELNGRGYILPGLGDAGDRLFGTTG